MPDTSLLFGPPPVAIVGVGALLPGSSDVTGFWRNVMEGRDLVTEVPATRWLIEDHYDADPAAVDKTYCTRGAFLSPAFFDPLVYGIPPSILPATDTTQLLALIVARQVLEDAFTAKFESVDKSRMSVILGVTAMQDLFGHLAGRSQRPQWLEGMRAAGIPEDEAQRACDAIAATYASWQESSFPGLLGNVVAGRIANRFNLGGTNCITDAACASSHSAIAMGLSELYLGISDVVIAGGCDTFNDIAMFMCFSKTPALSPTGDCRPFSDTADGTILGEGLAMFALKRLADAERDGDQVYGVIRAIGSSSDGKGLSVYAPVAAGQEMALRRTYEKAGYDPTTVELVEAHGTGTRAGDVAEFQALRTVFAREDESQWCALGSVKSQIGHTKAAAGAAGILKALMALHHKVLPPTIKVVEPNSKLKITDSPFYLNTKARPWVRDAKHPRRAGISAFGFGGSNFHVTLEEYTGPARRPDRCRTMASELILISAQSTADILVRCRDLIDMPLPKGQFAHLARQSQIDFQSNAKIRLAIVALNEPDLKSKLQQAAEAIEKAPLEAMTWPSGITYSANGLSGPLALLFPGQGSQYVGMGADLAMSFDSAREVWDKAANLSYQPHRWVFPMPVFSDTERDAQQQELTETAAAQPSIGLASLAQLSLLRKIGLEYTAVGGHSFGEITALHAAEVLDSETMIAVARRRGELMADAAHSSSGVMAVVNKPAAEVRAWLAKAGNTATLANDNGPSQVVISGEADIVAAAEKLLAGFGATVRRLPVATAFHSPVVAGSVAPFISYLGNIPFGRAIVSAFSNVTAQPYPEGDNSMRELLSNQIANPVRFAEMIEAMYASGSRTFLEVGPGSTLTGLVGEILKGRPHRAITMDRKNQNGVTSFWQALGQLAVAGCKLDYTPLWAGYGPLIDPADRTATKFSVSIDGGNYGRPYPPAPGTKEKSSPNPSRETPVAGSSEPLKHAPMPSSMPVRAHEASESNTPSGAIGSLDVYQRLLTEGHIAYMKTMELTLAQGHTAFLQAMENTLRPQSAPILEIPELVGAKEISANIKSRPAEPVNSLEQYSSKPFQPVPVTLTPARPVGMGSEPNLMAILLSVVAEKTGYPVGSLELSMSLESDLGIDSIKRVEILSAMQDRFPHLPYVEAKEMGKLRTLADIVAAMHLTPPEAGTVSEGPAAPLGASPVIDMASILLSVVAEKTGYPVGSLELSMSLESDLGIDSIKRVEILSAMQDRFPHLPYVEAKEMGKLRTLADIVAAMHLTPPEAGTVSEGPAAPLGASPVIDMASILLSVVAEKTGYPVGSLELSMSLESDLGIDSIKRVEILSAMQDRFPHLPYVEAREMGKLRTLADIVAAMRLTAPEAGTIGGGADIEQVAPPANDMTAIVLSVIAEKSGYPTYMLDLSMSLERDLGIDPGKCDEILLMIGERLARRPATEMPTLRTIGDIVSAMGKGNFEAADEAHNTIPISTPHSDRFILKAVEAAASGHVILSKDAIIVTDDGSGVGQALVAILRNRGYAAELRKNLPASATQVIFLGGLFSSFDDDNAAIAVNLEAFRTARALAQNPTVLVMVQDTGGLFGLAGTSHRRALTAGLTGLAKTAALEWPTARVKAVDINCAGLAAAAVAQRLAAELLGGGSELEVGLLADGRRMTLALERAAVSPSAHKSAVILGSDDVVVASGGARGVTASTLIALARESRARFLLLGRTPLSAEPLAYRGIRDEPSLKQLLIDRARAAGLNVSLAEIGAQVRTVIINREVEATLSAIRSAGGEARYAAVDVRDEVALDGALAQIREDWGPITALVHGAAVLADKLIAEKTEEQFDSVFSTKVHGLLSLLAATRRDPLRTICLFSSVVARTGNIGQSDYAMANEVLNKIAQSEATHRGAACRVKSLNWGPWEGGMVSPTLASHFARQGVTLLALNDGARMMVDELREQASDDVEVVLGCQLPGHRDRLTLRMHVDRLNYPHVNGHRINGTPVLPAMQVMDWFLRAARTHAPSWQIASIQDFKVLKGITLGGFDHHGDAFDIKSEVLKSDGDRLVIGLQLVGAGGTKRYTAVAELQRDRITTPEALTLGTAPAAPWQRDQIYDALLFHRDSFEVISSLDGLSSSVGIATLLTGSSLGWPDEGAITDVAVLDGGLQLALLHGVLLGNQISLPTAIATFRPFQPTPWLGLVRCELRGQAAGSMATQSDIVFTDADGTPLAEILGLDMHFYAPAPVLELGT